MTESRGWGIRFTPAEATLPSGGLDNHGRYEGETNCKGSSPRFQVGALEQACCCCGPQLVPRQLFKAAHISLTPGI
jgi:hypothetical protein